MLDGARRAILVGRWSETAPATIEVEYSEVLKSDFRIPVQEDFVGFLFTKISEIEGEERFYTREWYLLKICLLYFFSQELTANDIFNIGFLSSQMESKFTMESDALKAQKAKVYRTKGSASYALSAPQKRKDKENAILSLRQKILEQHGPEAVRKDSNAAYYIRELAQNNRSAALIVGSKNQIISVNRIRSILGNLRRAGKID